MALRVDEKLNFIVPLEGADGRRMYVHAMPVGREIFDQYFLAIGQTFTLVTAGRLGVVAGPRLAWRLLRKAAEELGEWNGPTGVEQGFVGEIIRLSSVVLPGEGGGWEPMPLDQAMAQELLDEEDRDMVLNVLVFFTVSYLMLPKRMNGEAFRKDYLAGASRLWAAQTSSLGLMDFVNSLKTSTVDGSSGATAGTP